MYNSVIMQDFLNELEGRLGEMGQFQLTRTEDSLTAASSGSNGFLVTVWGDRDGTFIVNYGHYWHGHLDTPEEAAEWFTAGVFGKARLVCTYHWRYLVKTIVEVQQEGRWIKADTLGSCLMVFVWWLPRRTEIFINTAD